jgi:hypothetical protein
MKRGAIYVYWGTKFEAELKRSIDSLKRYHPELPIEVYKLPDNSTLLDKAAMMDKTPFESTVYLDTDTVVMGRLDFAFEKAEKFGLACCICECPWARRYGGLTGDVIEYNTGVLFFTKQAKPVFDSWKANAATMDSSIRLYIDGRVKTMPSNDQGGFAKAMEDTGYNPYVLPLNWNMRPIWHKTFFGPIRIWHDHTDVPDGLLFWNERQRLEQSIIRYTEGY